MTAVPDFAYAQARMHARHGARLDDAAWRRLGSAVNLLQLLQLVRDSTMRTWVAPLTEASDVHAVETWPRTQLRDYVREVARWQPPPWRAAAAWTSRLIDLPALAHLLEGGVALPWMREDVELAAFLSDDAAVRGDALLASDCAPIAQAWRDGQPLLDGWLSRWRSLWPPARRSHTAALDGLAALVATHLHRLGLDGLDGDVDAITDGQQRERLVRRLERGFRSRTHQPVAAYLHLALIAADAMRLRGELVRQRLFAAPGVGLG